MKKVTFFSEKCSQCQKMRLGICRLAAITHDKVWVKAEDATVVE